MTELGDNRLYLALMLNRFATPDNDLKCLRRPERVEVLRFIIGLLKEGQRPAQHEPATSEPSKKRRVLMYAPESSSDEEEDSIFLGCT
ncbi:hypothetical protein CRENBAI_022152 [Crenichthys baileyi]|uniref:Uncharacterized protein n=1 Tax=Crenichthys baileyi TaxID=28760 RepID=A0AAV9RXF8_9TELE